MGRQNEMTGSMGCGHLRDLFCPLQSQYVFRPPLRPRHGSPEGLR